MKNMSVSQTKRKNKNFLYETVPKDSFIKFIKDDLGSKALNQIKSLVRRRDFTKKTNYYNERIEEVLLHEFKKKSVV